MRFVRFMSIAATLALAVQAARGETIWEWTHQASGSGTANVFDGGPPRTDGGTLTNASGATFQFGAFDDTRPGTLGAHVSASGASIISTSDDEMTIYVDLTAAYTPSSFGGDNPGGMAEATLSSVIEFVAPAEEITWNYGLGIRQTLPFDGATQVILENLSRSQVLLDLTSQDFSIGGILGAAPGDVLRLTTTMEGHGIVLVQRELDNPPIVLSNSPPHVWRGSGSSSLPPAGVLGLGSGTAGGRPFRPVASTPPGTG